MMSFMLSLLLCIGSIFAFGQNKVITGTVKDSLGFPVTGASVSVKNSKSGTVTDAAGRFRLNVPATASSIVVSFVGYDQKELAIGSGEEINVSLTASRAALQDVVVVGFGKRAENKKLSYAATSVTGAELARTNTPNPVNALQGKVPGLYMSNVAGGPQTSSRILLRGISDITPGANNQPLFVIDGVLIQPSITSTGAQYGNDQDFGNQLKNLNADDIESITVLKGSAATSLYGSAAQNGVILVTSKKGGARRGLGVTVSQQYSVEQPYGGADFQNEYGGGANPAYFKPGTTDNIADDGNDALQGLTSFGPKFQGQTVVDLDGRTVKWVPHPNNYLDVYRNGSTYNSNVALDGGNENTTFRLSWSTLASKGITPTNQFNKNTLFFRATHKIGKLIDIDATVTYGFSNVNNPNSQNSSSRSLFNAFVFSVPRQYDAAYYNTHFTDPVNGGLNVNESDAYRNAGNGYSLSYFLYKLYYWNSHLNENTLRSNLDITLHFTPWLKLLMRGNVFNTYSTKEQKFWGDGPNFSGNLGKSDDFSNQYSKDKWNDKSYRVQGLLTADKKLAKDLDASFSIGGEIYNKGTDGEYGSIRSLQVPGLFTLGNYANYNNTSFGQYDANNYRNVSFYAFGDLGYKEQLFLNFSERVEYSSSLVFPNGTGNNVYQYPGVGLSWLIHKTINLPSVISFAKIRTSFANTGKDILPWQISSDFQTYTYSGSYQTPTGTVLPVYGFSSNQIIDPNLRPQRTAEYEAGLNLQFLNNRLGIDVAVFNKTTKEQIASKSLATESGASSLLLNIGTIRNRGIEINLNATPLKTRDFNWSTNVIFTKYANKIISYASTTPYVGLESQYFTEVRAYVGQAYGDIYSNNALTLYQAVDASGNKKDDPLNGKPVIYNPSGLSYSYRYMPTQYASAPYDNNARKLGNINPDFLWSWSNTFNFKNFFAGFMIDGRVGGKILSFSYKYGTGIGALTSSLPGRDKSHGGVTYTGKDANGVQGTWDDGIIPDGVFAKGLTDPATGADIGGLTYADAVSKGYVQPLPASWYYYSAYGSWSRGIADLSTFDDSWVSLREVNVGYNFPKSVTQKIKVNNARISLVGRNLLYLFNNLPSNINPEGIFNNRASSAFEFGAGPSTRSMGISLNANF